MLHVLFSWAQTRLSIGALARSRLTAKLEVIYHYANKSEMARLLRSHRLLWTR
jgi:hypothetical protein